MKCPKIKAISGLIGIGIAVALMGLSLLFGLLYGDDGNVNVICIIGMILGFAIFLISAIVAGLDNDIDLGAALLDICRLSCGRLDERNGIGTVVRGLCLFDRSDCLAVS